MTYRKRVDANHKAITQLLRAHGLTVTDTSRLPGFVDLVVSWCPDCPRVALVEVKQPKGRLTELQKKLHETMPIWTVRDEEGVRLLAQWLKHVDTSWFQGRETSAILPTRG